MVTAMTRAYVSGACWLPGVIRCPSPHVFSNTWNYMVWCDTVRLAVVSIYSPSVVPGLMRGGWYSPFSRSTLPRTRCRVTRCAWLRTVYNGDSDTHYSPCDDPRLWPLFAIQYWSISDCDGAGSLLRSKAQPEWGTEWVGEELVRQREGGRLPGEIGRKLRGHFYWVDGMTIDQNMHWDSSCYRWSRCRFCWCWWSQHCHKQFQHQYVYLLDDSSRPW